MRLKDKVAIITGSAWGMGRVFALRFARERWKEIPLNAHRESRARVQTLHIL